MGLDGGGDVDMVNCGGGRFEAHKLQTQSHSG